MHEPRGYRLIDKNKSLNILKKYAVYGAFLGLIIFFLLLYGASSEEPSDITLSDIGNGFIFSSIYGALLGVIVAVIRIIGISIEKPPGIKMSVPIIFVCTLSFVMIGSILGSIIGFNLGISKLYLVGGFGGIFIGWIVGMYISALYYHEDVRKTIRYAIDEIL